MGLTDRVRRWALARPPVLIITAPGNDRLRWLVEAQADRRGWPLAHAPADADLLLTVGPLGPQLSAAVDILWSQIPGPRHRAVVTREAIGAQLDAAAMALVAPEAYGSDSGDPAALLGVTRPGDHEAHAMDQHSNNDPATTHSDHADRSGQHGIDGEHTGHTDSSDDQHSGDDDAIDGLPMAGTAPDRDGLELDELNITLGPVLPAWPAGLVVQAALQGDVLTRATVSWVDDSAPIVAPSDAAGQRVLALDVLARFLLVAGWPRAARQARAARTDLAWFETSHAARGAAAAARLARTVSRSHTLAWSVRGLGSRTPGDSNGVHDEDVWDRVLRWCALAAGSHTPGQTVPVLDAVELQDLLAGTELAAARLIVASVDPRVTSRSEGVR